MHTVLGKYFIKIEADTALEGVDDDEELMEIPKFVVSIYDECYDCISVLDLKIIYDFSFRRNTIDEVD